MNENINLCEILKDCPKGTKFWSPIYGVLRLFDVLKDTVFPIRFTDENNLVVSFMSNGFNCEYNVECLVFPDKNQRDWSKFKPKKPKFSPKTLEVFDKVLVRDTNNGEWLAMLFSHINTKGKVIVGVCPWVQVVPYNEDTKHLVGTAKEAPEYYRYWEE